MRVVAWALETAVKDALDGIGKSDKLSGGHTEVRMNLQAFAGKWAALNDGQKQILIPHIVRAITLNETFDDLKVTLRADALEYFE